MTLAELLKANGITDDVIEKITSGMKENKIFTTGEENLDIRYGKLKDQHDGTVAQLGEANKLIEELKKSSKGNEDLQGKIKDYETQVADLQKQLTDTKIKSAIKVALLSEKAVDIDYLTFKLENKLKEDNKTIELDDNDNIKGWNDMLSGLKTQFPTQFESSSSKKIEENKLGSGDDDHRTAEPKTLAEALKQADENKE